jgi:Raf kinase inhibitor-like YbhB/YbcL family protein
MSRLECLPPIILGECPADTKNFAITTYEKDAPTGSGFWHWLIFNIPASTNELKSRAGDISSGGRI